MLRTPLLLIALAAVTLGGCRARERPIRGRARAGSLVLDRPVERVREDANERTLRDALGEVTVPAHPTRVLPLGFTATDALVVLGVTPAAAPLHMSHAEGDFADYARPYLRGVPSLSVFDAGLERILATHPDLILADAGTPFSIDQLRRVAPTVVMRVASAEQRLLDVGTVLGLRDRAEARLAEHAEKMQRARALLAPFAGTETVALLRVHQKQFRLYGDRLGCAPVLFDVLGLRPSPLVQRRVIEPGLSQSPLSEESLALLDADRVFLYVDPPAQARTHLLLARNPVWRTLPAVRAGRVHRLTSAIIWNSVLARERMVDDVLEAYGQERICGT